MAEHVDKKFYMRCADREVAVNRFLLFSVVIGGSGLFRGNKFPSTSDIKKRLNSSTEYLSPDYYH